MQYRVLPVTPFMQNCSLVWEESDPDRRGVFIDPGGEADRLLQAAAREKVTVEKILLTHGHIDHVGAAAELRDRLGVPIEGPHRDDRFLLAEFPQQCVMFGFPPAAAFLPDRWLSDGETLTVGLLEFKVLHCPGHTPGHVAFYVAGAKHAFVGDILFRGSIGRTDFPRGDHRALLRSIREKLWPLGDEVTFLPGHGPASRFGAERRHNPFVGDPAR